MIVSTAGLFEDGQEVVRVKELVFLAVELDLGAAVFADEHAVADLDFERDFLPVVVGLARAERTDDAFLRFLFGGIGDNVLPFFVSFSSTGSTRTRSPEGFYI